MSFSTSLRLTVVVLFLFGLSACGGGSGSRGGPGAGTPPKSLDLDKLSTAGITTPRDAVPVFAQDETDTLGEVLANPANVVPALAATLYRHRAAGQGVELATDLFVKYIRRHASGAYVIDYVLDGADEQVIIPLDSCHDGCRVTDENGREFAFWSDTRDDRDMATVEDGLGEFEYLAVQRVIYRPDDTQRRTSFVFGVRNEDVPMGTATYHARFRTRTWETANVNPDQRQRIRGVMRIVANFDIGALMGRVYGIEGTRRGDGSADRVDWLTSSFTLTDGRIVNGQFTATLTGVDDDPNTPLDKSVRDFMGHVLGEFYGPNAEEVGGVVTATRDVAGTADDRVLYGYITGRKTDRLTGVNDSEALFAGADRDHIASTTTVTAIVERPIVQSTADGYKIIYVVDGQTQTVEFSESDFGFSRSGNPSSRYEKETDGPYDGPYYRLWDQLQSFESTRSYHDRFRPEHFDVLGLRIVNGPLDQETSSTIGYLIHGNRTTDMPTTGTADYDGGFRAREMPSGQAPSTDDASVTDYHGDINLSADFGSSAVTGDATLLQSRPGNGPWVTASGELSFNATISSNGLSATDLSGSGDLAGYSGGRVDGAFYGPGAAEVAGVFDATDGTQDKVLHGYFGGQKQ